MLIAQTNGKKPKLMAGERKHRVSGDFLVGFAKGGFMGIAAWLIVVVTYWILRWTR